MPTTETIAAIDYIHVPTQESRIEVEPRLQYHISKIKRARVLEMIDAGGSMTCIVIFILAFALTIPILQIIVGRHYRKRCPIQPKIPFFLCISGIIGLVTTLFPYIKMMLPSILRGRSDNATKKVRILNRILDIVPGLLSVFLMGWLNYGALLTFSVFNKISYDEKDQKSYCHHKLYVYTIVLLVLGFLQPLGPWCCGRLECKCGS
jgi:hypothetical protein